MADSDALISSFHDSHFRTCWALTGGGAGVANLLLSVPGGSRTILEITIPYSETALVDYLGQKPEQACSVATAAEMARAARTRARLLDPQAFIMGFGCTASLRSDRAKRGDHRVHVAAESCNRTLTRSLTLTKEARSRVEEEDVVARMLLNLAAEAAERVERVSVPLLAGEEIVITDTPRDPLAEFLEERLDFVCIESSGRVRDDGPRPTVIVSGSFNPVHEGHMGLADIAIKQIGKAASFELSILNADKPPLAPEEVRRRILQFRDKADLWLTRDATFYEKSLLFPGAIFVVGADTAARIVDPRFYDNNGNVMDTLLDGIRRNGNSFLVAGRLDKNGKVVTLDDLNVPAEQRDLFQAIPLEVFRNDCSSTGIRAAKCAE